MGDISKGSEISLIRSGDFEIGADGVSAETSVQVVIEDVTPITLIPLEDDLGLVLGTGPAVFTRATIATFVDKDDGLIKKSPSTGGNIQARFEQEGHLHEGASTNLFFRSEEFDNATWQKTELTVSADDTTAPDGATTADKLVETAVNATHRVRQTTISIVNTNTYTCSVYAKKGERNWILINADSAINAKVWFDVDAGVVGTEETGSGVIEDMRNGWFRCSAIGTATATASAAIFVQVTDADSNTTYLGDITKGLFLWGAQIEMQPAATSYIATTTTAVTRTADRLDIPVANMPNGPANFSVAITVAPLWIGTATGANLIAWATTGETDNNRFIQLNATDNFDWQIATTTVETNAATATTSLTKYVGTHDEGVASIIYLDGVAQTDTEAGSRGTTTITALSVGSQTTTTPWFGHIKDFRVYDVALTASQVKGV